MMDVPFVILFGAGASAYSEPRQSPAMPPLGCHLYRELAKCGGEASRIPVELQVEFEADFERGMALYSDTYPERLGTFIRELAVYLVKFAPGPNSHYRKIARLLSRMHRRVLLASLNYDLLLEWSIAAERQMYSYSHAPSDKGFGLAKLHGSCNFIFDRASVPTIVNARMTSLSKVTRGSMLTAPITVVQTRAEIEKFCDSGPAGDGLAPAMAIYMPNKFPYCNGPLVHLQLERFQQALKVARRLIVIGVSVNEDDRHIWDAVLGSPAEIVYVDPSPTAKARFEDWAKRHGRSNVVIPGQEADTFAAMANHLPAFLG